MKMKKVILSFVILSFSISFYSCKEDITSSSSPTSYKDYFGSWSPDGSRIIYTSGDDGHKIFSVDTNSTNKQPVVDGTGYDIECAPDGNSIVYENNGYIYKKDLLTNTITQLTTAEYCSRPRYSTDGVWIIYIYSSRNSISLWKMRSDGTEQTSIIDSPHSSQIYNADWFPDGKKIVISRIYANSGPKAKLEIVDLSGNVLSVLPTADGSASGPRVSPDGLSILYSQQDLSIRKINTDGTGDIELGSKSDMASWSPDGNMIVYSNIALNEGRIWIMNKDGSGKRKISY